MPEPDDNKQLIESARKEIAEMAKEGFDHPSAKPVLIGAAIGALVGGAIPGFVTWPLGLIVGAIVALYLRIKK